MKRKRREVEKKEVKKRKIDEKCLCVYNRYNCNCHFSISYIKSLWKIKDFKFKVFFDKDLVKMFESKIKAEIENLPILLYLDPIGGERKIFGKIQKVKSTDCYCFEVRCLLDIDKDWNKEFKKKESDFRVKNPPNIGISSYECFDDQHDFKILKFEKVLEELKEKIKERIKRTIKTGLERKMNLL